MSTDLLTKNNRSIALPQRRWSHLFEISRSSDCQANVQVVLDCRPASGASGSADPAMVDPTPGPNRVVLLAVLLVGVKSNRVSQRRYETGGEF